MLIGYARVSTQDQDTAVQIADSGGIRPPIPLQDGPPVPEQTGPGIPL